MPHVRKLIRDAATTALAGLATTGANVFPSRARKLHDAQIPGLRVYLNAEQESRQSIGLDPVLERHAELVVEGVAKAPSDGTLDDLLDAINLEVETRMAANQTIGGAKSIAPTGISLDLEGEGEKERGIITITFDVLYYTTRARPDVAL